MNRKLSNKGLIVFICLLLVLILFGCSSKSNLVGVWQGEMGDSIEFLKDGTVIIVDQFFSASGKYSVLDDNRIRLEMDGIWGIAGSQVFSYQMSGNNLILEGITYTKIR